MIYKKGRYYMTKFMWKGKLVRKSTRATDKKTARSVEAQIRTELAKGNWGILERKPAPVLSDFVTDDFLPFCESRFHPSSRTLKYYRFGANLLSGSDLISRPLNEITDQHAGQFAASLPRLSAATKNCGLRTLRRALALAVEWGKLDRMPKISLVKGERQRERVLTNDEIDMYLGACPQPWRDAATLMLGTGLRPGEVYPLRWENVVLNGKGGLIGIREGKSKAAKRVLPLVPKVFNALRSRYIEQGMPSAGWVFPTQSKSGHLEQGTAKRQHAAALKNSKVSAFEPYCLRHTALTNMAASGCDSFTLARIAGHSSISITQRYCHPQADAIEQAFTRFGESQKVVTEGGHPTLEPTTSETGDSSK